MQNETPTYKVRFSNGAAVRDLSEARELVDDMLIGQEWNVNLKHLQELLSDAWDGLTFQEDISGK